MVREIKTTLALDGEKKFKEAMADAAREMRVIKADLKAVSAEFSATDDAQKYYAQRTELLNQKVRQQTEIVDALSRAVKDSASKYGDAAKETDGYRIKLSNATAELFKMRREAEDAARELEELGRDSDKIGRQIENGIGDAAEEVSESLDGMFAKVASDVNALKGSVAFQTTMNVGEFVMDGIQGVMDFVNENQELNTKIAYAKHNLATRNIEWDEVKDLVVKAAAATGNMEGGIEAISHLAQLEFDDKGLMEAALNAMMGAYIRTGGALSIESLAEDFRASVVSRIPTGTYAEVLEEVLKDVSVDEITKALQGAKNEKEAIEIALSVLTEGGLQTTYQDFAKEEKELMEAKSKQAELTLAWAGLAEKLQPYVTKIIGALTKTVQWTTEGIASIESALGKLRDKITEANNTQAEALGLTEEEYNMHFWQRIGQGAYGIQDTGYIPFRSPFVDLFTNAFPSAGAEELESQWAIQGEKDAQAYYNAFGDAFESSEHADVYRNAFEQLGVDTSTTEAEEAGAEIGQAVVDGMESATEGAYIAGQNISTALGNGIAAAAPGALQNAMDLVSQMNDVLGMVAVPWYMSPTQFQIPTPQGGGGSVPVGIDIDGQRVGEVLYDSISRAGGRAVMNTMLVK